jgi:hypothetical protein
MYSVKCDNKPNTLHYSSARITFLVGIVMGLRDFIFSIVFRSLISDPKIQIKKRGEILCSQVWWTWYIKRI